MCRGLKDMQDTKYFSLLRALAGDTMTSLELYWISPIGASFLPNASAPVKGILLLSPRLKHLSLTAGIHWIGEEALQLEQLLAYLPPQVLNLSTLSITMHCMDFVLDWLSKTMAFPSLTHLYLRFKDGFDVDVLQRFLDTSVRSVKWLFIDRVLDELDPMFDNEEEFMPCLNLANLTHLQSIQLSFPDHRYFIRPIINMVRSIPPVARLTSIVLLSVYTEGQPIEQLLDLWIVLDAFLASDSHEALQQVVVRPQLGPYFGKCREKGILVDAENRYPLKKRWDVACARAYSDSY
ncbi:hypothetical protein VNI00_006701 [Paramarasmius palmivorus]|uniref:Uncharacterized protein n=1 Tax=Paramarasmius palmivorus TaxID=297713 RepID=A0AAW0D773_9AGAR